MQNEILEKEEIVEKLKGLLRSFLSNPDASSSSPQYIPYENWYSEMTQERNNKDLQAYPESYEENKRVGYNYYFLTMKGQDYSAYLFNCYEDMLHNNQFNTSLQRLFGIFKGKFSKILFTLSDADIYNKLTILAIGPVDLYDLRDACKKQFTQDIQQE